MKLQRYLTEKQIIVGNGQAYGQIVFLAGGAGSGKGFSATNFMEKSKFKVRDVDELKKAVVALAKLKGDNPEIANIDFGKAEDVFKIHQHVKEKGLKDKTLDLLLRGASKGTLPNIMFDVTLKDQGDIYEVLPSLFDIGYKPIDVHLVWILTDFEIAIEQNKKRERRVPDDILLKTHTGAALTVTDLLRGKIRGIGPLINGSINIILGGSKHTVVMTTQDTRETIKGKEKFTQLGGDVIKNKGQVIIKSFKYINVKEEGKPMKSSESFNKELFDWEDLRSWVKSNIPKTMDTRNIRRRQRI